MVVCPAIIHSRHGTGNVDTPFDPGSNEAIVQDVPVLGSYVLPCCFVQVWESEQGVGYSQVIFCTETKQQMYFCATVANTKATNNALHRSDQKPQVYLILGCFGLLS